MAVLVIFTGWFLALPQGIPSPWHPPGALEILPPLLMGAAGLLLASVLPDMDGRGKIRWTMGPVLGIFALAPPVLATLSRDGPYPMLDFVWNPGSRLFLVVCAAGLLLPHLPFKHRGSIHSVPAAFLAGTMWMLYNIHTGFLTTQGSILAGAMVVVGYLWHLSLDGKLAAG